MIRVLRILNRFNLGGPTYNASYLTKHLAPEFETLLVGGTQDASEESSLYIPHHLGIEPVLLERMQREVRFLNDYSSYRELKKMIKSYQPHIVHTHASKAGVLGRLAAHNMNVPVIVHTFHGHVFHSYFGKAKTGFYKQVERYMARRSHGIIAISETQKNELAEKYRICPAEKIQVIPLGFDLTRFTENKAEKRKVFREHWKISDDTVAIGIIGRLVPIKNHTLFIDALALAASNSRAKIRGYIVGDGELKQSLQAYCSRIGVSFSEKPDGSALLTFTSWQKEVDVVNAGLDVIALTSFNEGTPVSLIEAQASAKPIISTRVGGIQDVVHEGKTTLLTDTTNVQQFAGYMQLLAEHTETRVSMGENSPEFVLKSFGIKRLTSDMASYYHTLLEKQNVNI